ncbi:metallophosphoesterase family protein [Nibricoccus aquaticus]|uniref:metallophosphoesterase family protein n=1 Tax=Nibricoccus aquaticus TaxID=2576891 RepID=UPI001586273E|nr:metallophosphoesterase family protein [Nibricoccus aquaticus]
MLTRILSDLHFDDATSQVRSLAMLRPLIDGADRIIVNGDALDSQVTARGPELIREVKTFFAAHTPEALFIAGNHDPDISSVNELLLAGGQIWLTHGDVFFEYLAPWSPSLPEYRRRIHALRDHLPPVERDRLDTRYRILRAVSIGLPPEHDPADRSPTHQLARLARIMVNPRRPLSMIHAWLTSPRTAATMAAQHHPSARFVIFGHIHHPGVWKKSRHIVINTGSFTPPRGALMVEFDENNLRVRRIDRRSSAFHPGRIIAEFPLAPAPAAP